MEEKEWGREGGLRVDRGGEKEGWRPEAPISGPPRLGQGSRLLWPRRLQTGEKVLHRGAHQAIRPAHAKPAEATKAPPRPAFLCILTGGSTASSLV